jgi:uncharacterized Ntn-hydrolase superfamily protein
MTLSIAGRCARTGQFGVAITSSSPAVAARCAYVRTGVGAACSQNITDPRLGRRLLDLMAAGSSAPDAVAEVVASEPLIEYRQISAVDATGRTGSFSGAHTLGVHATAESSEVVAAGNLLASADVPAAMIDNYRGNEGLDLAERLISALKSGLAAGGEAGPVHSAGLLIHGDVSWAITDLRVDWSQDPVLELERVWYVWRPQVADYLQRALRPEIAPSYGVPGDPDR